MYRVLCRLLTVDKISFIPVGPQVGVGKKKKNGVNTLEWVASWAFHWIGRINIFASRLNSDSRLWSVFLFTASCDSLQLSKHTRDTFLIKWFRPAPGISVAALIYLLPSEITVTLYSLKKKKQNKISDVCFLTFQTGSQLQSVLTPTLENHRGPSFSLLFEGYTSRKKITNTSTVPLWTVHTIDKKH